MITYLFPGSGINPFTVDDLSWWWWDIYLIRARAHVQSLKEVGRG